MRLFFKRLLPERHKIQGHKNLRILGDILHDPDIFHLTRRSAAGGMATGLFFAFLPFPGQMLVAALFAIILRVNLPLSVILVWITNPITIPPIMYLAYKTGSLILNSPHKHIDFSLSWQWFSETLVDIWPSLLVGCLLFSIIASVTGYLLTRWLWRINIIRKWEARKNAKIKN